VQIHAIRVLCVLMLAMVSLNIAFASCIGRQNTAVPISTPTASFAIRSDGTVADPRTGLMWMRCMLGQAVNNGACAGTATTYTWADALSAARALTYAGHSDWRLPNPKEVASILEDRCAAPALNADLFPTASFGTWTSTPARTNLLGVFDDVWVVGAEGDVVAVTKNQTLTVILVRKMP
jgi:hypothetical protein